MGCMTFPRARDSAFVSSGETKTTNVTTAMKKDTDGLALLYFGQVELCQPFAGIQVVLRGVLKRIAKYEDTTYVATHQNDKDAPPNIGVHALFPRKFHEGYIVNVFCIDFVGFRRGGMSLVDERVPSPCSTD